MIFNELLKSCFIDKEALVTSSKKRKISQLVESQGTPLSFDLLPCP